MPEPHVARFDEVLEAIEALPEELQESLIEVVRRSICRRAALARSIQEAREELAQGSVRRGSVDDLLGEI